MFQFFGTGPDKSEPELILSSGADGSWIMPEDVALFTAEFARDGRDLMLQSTDGSVARLVGYFTTQDTPDILSHDGATLRGAAVDRLAGPMFPGQYAQAGGGFDLTSAIGQVEAVSGGAFVQRVDGSTEELQIGVKVFQGDVVRTSDGGTLSLTFADGTIFSLASGSRMVLDELIYDPDSTSNSGVFDLVEGSFVFIAGQTAKTGGIEINSPAATMGIRGTTGLIDIQTINGILRVTVSLNPDPGPDGRLGEIELFDLAGNLITTITTTDTKWIISPPFTGEAPIEVERTSAELVEDAIFLNQAAAAFQSAINRVLNGETFVEYSEGDADGQGDGPEDEEGDEPSDSTDPLVPPPLDETGDGDGEGRESGSGNPELDGTDEPLPEGETGTGEDDDASLNNGNPPTQTASNAVNAPPEFSDTPIRSLEDTPLTGRLPVSDREGNEIEVTLTRGAENGSVVLSSDGTFTYTPDENFEGTDTFQVTAVDSEGASSDAEITVVVDAVNDAPVVTIERQAAATSETREGEAPGPELTGVLTYEDVDEGEVPGLWSIAADANNVTMLGSAIIDEETGQWTYTLDQIAANALSEGQTVLETFIATITDAGGATDVSRVEITITGTNDGPVLTSSIEDAQATLAEAAFGFVLGEEAPVSETDDAPGSVSDTLTYADADQNDTPGQWSIVADDGNTTTLGTMEIDALTGTWVYTLDESAADVLGNGDMVVEVFTATITDTFGATASQAVTITITGFNDAPTITFAIEDIEATVFEDGFVASTSAFGEAATADEADASGVLRYVDPDGQPGETATWSISPDGPSLGEMTIDAVTGEWHYCLDETAAQSLKEGEEVVETFTAVVTDSLGASSAQVITITVIGSNDEAEIQADAQDLRGEAEEDGNSTASGQLSFVDADANPEDVATWSVEPVGDTRGSMTIEALSGAWSYTLDQTKAQSLGQGEVAEEQFAASVTDGLGAVATQIITIFLTGENDAPVVTSSAVSETVVEAGADGPGVPTVNGTLTFTDVDDDASTPFWTIAADAGNPTNLGSMTIDPTSGAWSYTLDQSAADYLQTGDVVTEEFSATITDAFGASDDTTITITIEGTNDAPVLSAASAGLTEEDTDVSVDLAGFATDPDAGEEGSTLSYAIVSGPSAGSARLVGSELIFETDGDFVGLALGQTQDIEIEVSATDAAGASDTAVVTISITGSNGAPTLSATSRTVSEDAVSVDIDLTPLGDDPDADENGGTLDYQINSAPGEGHASISGKILKFEPGSDFEDLGNGESRDVQIGITAIDTAGETATAVMTVTVTGSNDAPVITSSVSAAEGNVTEPGDGVAGALTAQGTLTYTDTDETAPGQGQWTISPASSALGSMSIGAGTGEWTYTLDASAADALTEGEVRTEVFTAKVTDNAGDSDTQVVTITINGTNDAPTVSGASEALSESDGSINIDLSALGQDTDAGETGNTLDFAISNGPSAGTAAISGRTLTFAVGDDFKDLGDGETREVSVTIRATDSENATGEGTVTITVTGNNDAPVITSSTAAAQGTVEEPGEGRSGNLTTGGTLTYIDEDASSSTSGQWSVNPQGTPLGSISINATTGAWEYSLDADAADALDEGDAVEETFTATITDEHGATDTQQITVTVRGTNDAPTLQSASLDASEDDTAATANLAALADDPDSDDTVNTLSFRIVDQPDEGSASISGSTLRFSLGNDFEDLAEGQERQVTVGIEVRDRQGATATEDVVFTVEGTNDAPVITSNTAAARGTVVEPGATTSGDLSASGTLTYFDVDETAPNQGDWSVTPSGRALGQISINQTTGVWTYLLSATAANSLAAGDIRTELFTATVEDAAGAKATQEITITIRGSNDTPTITAASRDISEDGGFLTINLAGLANDPDNGETPATLNYDVISQPSDGSAQVLGSVLRFNTDDAFEHLARGQEETVSIGVRVRDGGNASDQTTINITIEGENDAPEITSGAAAALGTAEELGSDFGPAVNAGAPDATGTLTYQDPDAFATDPATWSVSPDGTGYLGVMTINPTTGKWDYFLDQKLADSLFEGETVIETFTAKIEDEFGGADTQQISITILGANDRPVILATSQTTGAVTEGADIAASGQINVFDPDDFTIAPSWTINPNGDFSPQYGEMTISDTGRWTYAVDAEKIQGLAQGEMDSETFRIRITDEFDASDTVFVTVNFTGTNTKPVITSGASAASGAVTEPGDGEAGTLTAMGTLTYQDPDEGVTSAGWEILPSDAVMLGSIGINSAGKWTYQLDPAKADSLNAGQEVTETFQAVARDVHGLASEAQTITITILGTNDVPILTQSGMIFASADELTKVDLKELAFDPDAEHDPSGLTYTIANQPAEGSASITDGELTFDPNGEFAGVEFGGYEDVSITVRVEDDEGGFSNTAIVLRVAGENDPPEITSDPEDAEGKITEQGFGTENALRVSGQLNYFDPDEDDDDWGEEYLEIDFDHEFDSGVGDGDAERGWSIDPENGTFGSITINRETGFWEYTLNQAAADELDEGDKVEEKFTAKITDDVGAFDTQVITVFITGANDKPSLTGAVADVYEDGAPADIMLAPLGDDPDDDEDGSTLIYDVVSGPDGASINGQTLTFDPGSDYQSLAKDQEFDITVKVSAEDNFGVTATADFVFTVIGVNDDPEAANIEVDYTGTGEAQKIDVLSLASDPDLLDTLMVGLEVSTSASGFADVDPSDGTISYTPGDDFEGVEILTYEISDGNGGTDQGTIKVTVPDFDTTPEAFDDMAEAALVSRAGASGFDGNGHFYQFVRGYYTWDEANAEAAAKGGYLATLTSAPENSFGGNLLMAAGGDIDGWIGGSDLAQEGDWDWVQGPEDGQAFFAGGNAVGDAFVNWVAGQPEIGPSNQDFLSLSRFEGHFWDDAIGSDPRGYLLEYNSVPLITGDVSTNDSPPEEGDTLIFALDAPLAGLEMETDGSWTFDPTNAAYADLAEGATQVLEANYSVKNEAGETGSATLKITITGANDAPTVQDDVAKVAAGTWSEFNDHHYRHVSGIRLWDDANEMAVKAGGYLATITTQAENTFVQGLVSAPVAWLGGRDNAEEGTWRWAGGPEAGQQFWQGLSDGTVTNDLYANWATNEPLNISAGRQDHLVMRSATGKWDDLQNAYFEFAGHGNAGHVEELGTDYTFSGSVADNDEDPEGDTITYMLSGEYAGLEMDSNGNWKFDGSGAAYEGLALGETGFVNAYYVATDANGASTNGRLRLEVSGVNNAPVVQSEINLGTVSEDIGDTRFNVPSYFANRNLVDDVDSDDDAGSLTYSFSNFDPDIVEVLEGGIRFTIKENFNGLGEGQSETVTVDLTVTDQWGASDTSTLSLKVSGNNDAPDVAAIDAGSVSESAPVVTIDLLDGQSDIDAGDTLSVVDFSYSWSGDGPSPTVAAPVNGVITIDPADFTSLNNGDEADLLVTYKVSDGISDVGNTARLTITGESLVTTALDDDLRDQEIDVVILATQGTEFADTRNQLLDSTEYTFNVSEHKSNESHSYAEWSAIVASADVVLAGGEAVPLPSLSGQLAWEVLRDHHVDEGLAIVSTGYFPSYFGEFDQPSVVDTLAALDAITPAARGQSTQISDNTVDIQNGNHPITIGVDDFMLSASDWSLTENKDPGSTSLAIGSAPGAFAILYEDAPAVASQGVSVYLGGRYLGGNGSLTSLRSGEADQLLEQALNWAADNDAATNTDEDSAIKVLYSTLTQNDFADDGGAVTVTDMPFYSQMGATITMFAEGFIYDPTTSAQINNLDDGDVAVDTFAYTIENSAGTEADSATVTIGVLGVDDNDAAPVTNFLSGIGFESGSAEEYTVNEFFFEDHDELSDITYKFGQTSADGPLPDWLGFDPSTNVLKVNTALHIAADQGFKPIFLTGFEEDGDYKTVPFGLATNAEGDVLFTVLGFGGTADFRPILEIGLDGDTALDDASLEVLVDLSGVDALAPTALKTVGVIDISNGQANKLTIDPDDLLALIEGNDPESDETFIVRADSYDDVGFAESPDWEIVSVSESGDEFLISGTEGGVFAGFGDGAFATFFIDNSDGLPT